MYAIKHLYNLMDITKLYNKAYDWLLTVGPKLVIALVVLFVGEWLIHLLKKRSHKFLNRKNIDPSLHLFLKAFFTWRCRYCWCCLSCK